MSRTAAPARRTRRLGRLATAAAATTAALSLVIPAQSALAADTNRWMDAELPYVHSDTIGRRWIYAAGTGAMGASLTAQVQQYYGGAWHDVGYSKRVDDGGAQRAIASVLCTGAQTNYLFRTYVTQPGLGGEYSNNKTIGC